MRRWCKASGSRFYYDLARKLIEMGKAYVCTCPAEDWRKMKEERRACPQHNQSVEMEQWDRMLAGDYEEEKAVVVVKTDLHHPNPAIRDFVGFRIVKSTPHPRTGSKVLRLSDDELLRGRGRPLLGSPMSSGARTTSTTP